jgi:hypothetical protein
VSWKRSRLSFNFRVLNPYAGTQRADAVAVCTHPRRHQGCRKGAVQPVCSDPPIVMEVRKTALGVSLVDHSKTNYTDSSDRHQAVNIGVPRTTNNAAE